MCNKMKALRAYSKPQKVGNRIKAFKGSFKGSIGFYEGLGFRVNPIKLETGLRPNGAGIPYTLLLRIEAMGFPTLGLLLYILRVQRTQ